MIAAFLASVLFLQADPPAQTTAHDLGALVLLANEPSIPVAVLTAALNSPDARVRLAGTRLILVNRATALGPVLTAAQAREADSVAVRGWPAPSRDCRPSGTRRQLLVTPHPESRRPGSMDC